MLGLSLGQLYDELLLFGQEAVASITLTAAVVAGPQVNLAWTTAGVTSETGYLIEVRDLTDGDPFAELTTVGADVSVYEGDVGPFTEDHRYQYRVTVLGGPSDGVESNIRGVWPNGVPITLLLGSGIGIRVGMGL